jgi:hypothetical protein
MRPLHRSAGSGTVGFRANSGATASARSAAGDAGAGPPPPPPPPPPAPPPPPPPSPPSNQPRLRSRPSKPRLHPPTHSKALPRSPASSRQLPRSRSRLTCNNPPLRHPRQPPLQQIRLRQRLPQLRQHRPSNLLRQSPHPLPPPQPRGNMWRVGLPPTSKAAGSQRKS